ncbi:MAG: glycoside hydrolase family 78 protein [Clostridia bacterium]|nr:glycoside hydrolase family 78 protein [Clostridia bacterium]
MFSHQFIQANNRLCDFENFEPAPYFRKEFTLDFVPETAKITVAGLGFYELTVNGTPVTKGILAPYISNPADIVYYDEYEIAPHLVKGKNCIGLLLGNGMRNAFGGFVWDFEKALFRGPVCLALSLEAEGEGKTFAMEADESFRTHPSPVIFNDLRMGCRYDARMEIPGWDKVGFDDSDWKPAERTVPPTGEPRLCTVEPIVLREERKPVKIEHFDELAFAHESVLQNAKPFPQTVRKNVYVYDFGVNDAGLSVLHIHGKPGQKITIRHGEFNQGGQFSESTTIFIRPGFTDRYLEFGQRDEYICRGGDETFVPKFKYDGFRYLFVEGLTPEQATEDAFTFRIMGSAIAERGGFSSSDETLNTLAEMAKRSDRANFYYFPTDCPHREKNGWTGDASMAAEHMLLHMKAETSLTEWLRNICKAQNGEGALPGIVPTGGWGFEWGNGPTWDSVLFNLPLEIYRHTGDKSVILENLPAMLKYLSYSTTKKDADGLCAYGLGDWVDPFEYLTGKIASPLKLTDTVMLYLNAKKAAFLFREAGRIPEAEFAQRIAEDYRNAVREHLIDRETLTVAGDCQTSQTFALAAGIFNKDEEEKAAKRLVEIIHRDGDENHCGMIGVRHIFHVLNSIGETDLGYRMLTSKERTGYGSMVARGLTTLAENFYFEDGSDCGSQDHHFLGDFFSVFIQEYAGLKPNPTYRDPDSFEISPVFPEALAFAEAYYKGRHGKLAVEWHRADGGIDLCVTVPEGMHGALVLPKGYETDGASDLSSGVRKYFVKHV